MIGLDTNVLVRYLTQDDARQARQASAVIEEAIRTGEPLFLNAVVLAELIWALEDCYGYGKPQILRLLGQLLAIRQLEIGQKEAVRRALDDFRQTRADFADCLIGQLNLQAGCQYTWTLDKGLRGLATFRQV